MPATPRNPPWSCRPPSRPCTPWAARWRRGPVRTASSGTITSDLLWSGRCSVSRLRSGFFLALVPPTRFERAACGVGIRRSVQLSYGDDYMSRQPAPDRCGERGEGQSGATRTQGLHLREEGMHVPAPARAGLPLRWRPRTSPWRLLSASALRLRPAVDHPAGLRSCLRHGAAGRISGSKGIRRVSPPGALAAESSGANSSSR